MTKSERIADLLIRQLRGESSAADRLELEAWMAESEAHRQAAEAFLDEQRLARGIRDHWVEDRIWARLETLISDPAIIDIRRTPVYRQRLVRYSAVAAGILLALGLIYLFRPSSKKTTLAHDAIGTTDRPAPTVTHATLTLSGGRQILLDSAGIGTLARQGRMTIQKTSPGLLQYVPAGPVTQKGSELVFYNTLTNPRGSRVITLFLPDGTKVWLNAASSITYPTAFTGGDRSVSMSGEAYFEVAKNQSQPFKVTVKAGEQVEVLGTDFDIMAYGDEPDVKTTLLSGSIRVTASTSVELKPGQQAQLAGAVNSNNGLGNVASHIVNKAADVEAAVAWKNGEFIFNRADMAAILREVSRWYDLEIAGPTGPLHRTFSGIVSRESNLSDVMKILAGANIRFRVEGKKMILLP